MAVTKRASATAAAAARDAPAAADAAAATADAAAGGGARQPVAPPPFMLGELRKAVPPHCFKRSAARSAAYLGRDLALAAALYWAATLIEAAAAPAALKWLALWPAYWWAQGAVLTGVWVVAHECGHGAFSESPALNDAVGLALHSALLVPYYAWKHSHRRHHSNTASLERDEVFVPAARPAPPARGAPREWAQHGLVRAARLAATLAVGWPLYLLFNVASRPYDRFASHFDPWSPIFSKRERAEVAASDAALVGVLYGLGAWARTTSAGWVFRAYGAPYLVVNFWLVTITLLQHTHASLPHYAEPEWNWLQGALSTVDRSYGRLLNALHHHIADTHVAHHLFSQMPHYHAEEATAALRPLLGAYYRRDETPVLRALWRDWAACRVVAPDAPGGGVMWFRE